MTPEACQISRYSRRSSGCECPTGHAHVFGEVLQFAVRRARFDGCVDGVGIDGGTQAKAVGFDDEGVFVEFQAVFQVALGRFEDAECYVASMLDLVVHGCFSCLCSAVSFQAL